MELVSLQVCLKIAYPRILRQKQTCDLQSKIVGEATRVIAAMGPRAILGTIAWYLEFQIFLLVA